MSDKKAGTKEDKPKRSAEKINPAKEKRRKKLRSEQSTTSVGDTTRKESTAETRSTYKDDPTKSTDGVKAKTSKTNSPCSSYAPAGSKIKSIENGTKPKPKRAPRKNRDQMTDGERVVSRNNTWRVSTLLGAGGYGDVYKVTRADDDKAYAMKTEAVEDDQRKNRLKLEVEVLQYLRKAKEEDRRHFVTMLDRGRIAGKFKFIVMTLVGPALDDVRREHVKGGEFSTSTVAQIAKQSLEAIRDLHKIGFIHRDIKPQNFAIGPDGQRSTLFLLDFGICRRYLDRVTGQPREPREKVRFVGSLRFASRRCHESKEQGRKDDLEVWFYLIFDSYDSKAGLPWKRYQGHDRFKRIHKKKVEFMRGAVEKDAKEVTGLPWWSKVPRGYLDLMKYVDGLERFEQTPDYEMMLKAVERIAEETVVDAVLDWEKDEGENNEEKTQVD